jgi:hypothetical protein
VRRQIYSLSVRVKVHRPRGDIIYVLKGKDVVLDSTVLCPHEQMDKKHLAGLRIMHFLNIANCQESCRGRIVCVALYLTAKQCVCLSTETLQAIEMRYSTAERAKYKKTD